MDIKVPPLNVSPLIKGARWSLLILGIIYGSARHNRLVKKEIPRRQERERKKLEEAAKLKFEKERQSQESDKLIKEWEQAVGKI